MPVQPEPRFGGTLEIILEGDWRAVYVDETPVPDDLPALYAYALVVRREYGYVTEQDGEDGWSIVEGEIGEGENAEVFVARAARERTGAVVGRTLLIGYLACTATSFNERFETNTHAARPLYVAVADEVGPLPENSGYHRRRLPINKFQALVRKRYPALAKYLSRGLDRYLILQRTGRLAD